MRLEETHKHNNPITGYSRTNSQMTDTGSGAFQPFDSSFLDPPQEPSDLGMIAHYCVRRLIGEGGMGLVFEGYDMHLRRTVALKVMRREYIESYTSRERFLQEARVVAGLESDYIATIFQVGMHNDVPYLAMQYLIGETLEARLIRDAILPLPEALLIARQAGEGLSHSHHHGLVHRDIKPANIWLENDLDSRLFKRAKLLDFGLARDMSSDQKLTNMGVIIGTPLFMAPEQAHGRPVDASADIFSLGAVMYLMLTGRMPFKGDSAAALLMQIVSHDPPGVRTLNPSIPIEIDNLVAEMMNKKPEDRPSSIVDVVDAIDLQLIEMSGTGIPMNLPRSTMVCYPTQRIRPATTVEMSSKDMFEPVEDKPAVSETEPTERNAEAVPLALSRPDKRAAVRPKLQRPLLMLGLLLIGMIGGSILVQALSPGHPKEAAQAIIPPSDVEPTIPVAVFFALKGPHSELSTSLNDATLFAIEEVNAEGGVLGRQLKPVQMSPNYDADGFADELDQLLDREKVAAVFGIAGSADQRECEDSIDRHDTILFHAPNHEGMRDKARTIFTGMTASQSVVPALERAVQQGSKRVFVVGTTNIYSIAIAEIVKSHLEEKPTEYVGSYFTAMGNHNLEEMIEAVQQAKPDLVVVAERGGNMTNFIETARTAVPPIDCKFIYLNQLEELENFVDPSFRNGDWLLGSDLKPEFEERFRERFGKRRVVTNEMVSAYQAVKLWAKAVQHAGTIEADEVLKSIPEVQFDQIRIDPMSLNAWHGLTIDEYQPDGSKKRILEMPLQEPQMYLPTRSPRDWNHMLRQKYYEWGKHWRLI